MQTRTIEINSGWRKGLLAGACAFGIAAAVLFSKWAFGHAVAVNATELEVTALGVDLAPSDPRAHYAYGEQLEKTFLPGDQSKAFNELASATALSPHNYVYWLALARSQEQSGNVDAAESALRKAQQLAPNYARVQWALGNLLLRQDREQEAFTEIKKAAAADANFAGPAAAVAWQVYKGAVPAIHEAVGESPEINASIAVLLAGDKRFREAMDFWRRVSGSAGSAGPQKEAGAALYKKLIDGGAYRSAIEVANNVGIFSSGEAVAGTISNGGFESPLQSQTEGANFFSWLISDGVFPRIGQNEDQKRSGNYSLLVSFGQGSVGSRQISQKVGVASGKQYDLQGYYLSQIDAPIRFRCNVVTASGDQLGGMDLPASKEWKAIAIPFTVPDDVEGVEIRIAPEGCNAGGCSASGNIWFDDFSLTAR